MCCSLVAAVLLSAIENGARSISYRKIRRIEKLSIVSDLIMEYILS